VDDECWILLLHTWLSGYRTTHTCTKIQMVWDIRFNSQSYLCYTQCHISTLLHVTLQVQKCRYMPILYDMWHWLQLMPVQLLYWHWWSCNKLVTTFPCGLYVIILALTVGSVALGLNASNYLTYSPSTHAITSTQQQLLVNTGRKHSEYVQQINSGLKFLIMLAMQYLASFPPLGFA